MSMRWARVNVQTGITEEGGREKRGEREGVMMSAAGTPRKEMWLKPTPWCTWLQFVQEQPGNKGSLGLQVRLQMSKAGYLEQRCPTSMSAWGLAWLDGETVSKKSDIFFTKPASSILTSVKGQKQWEGSKPRGFCQQSPAHSQRAPLLHHAAGWAD